jgi:LmbE family N-acetylglucosaminyl deacetylase
MSINDTDRRIVGAGTDEAAWLASKHLDDLPECDLRTWVQSYRRIWIIAPHPDDEILGLGAAVVELSRLGARLGFLSVTDGEASHPGSPRWTPDALRIARHDELRRALDVLGVAGDIVRLRIPDGQVASHRDALFDGLIGRVESGDLMLVTWRRDGHPDHEACAEVARRVTDRIGAAMIEYPVWMWHWAAIDEASIPWSRARRLPASASARARKAEALAQFVSQTTADDTHDAILPPHVLRRFARPFELVFVQ